MSKRTVQVIMLPTNKSNLALFSNSDDYDNKIVDKLQFFKDEVESLEYNLKPQHLYFTSNEEIKEGDKFIWKSQMYGNTEIYTFKEDVGYGIKIAEGYIVNHSGNCGKVIATTDKSLNLPLIPQSFIEEYVKKNGEIKEVDIHNMDTANIPIVNNSSEIMFWTHGDEKSIKKQTLEEAINDWIDERLDNIYPNPIIKQDLYQAMHFIAKWQQSNN